jgi:hypothetical protein
VRRVVPQFQKEEFTILESEKSQLVMFTELKQTLLSKHLTKLVFTKIAGFAKIAHRKLDSEHSQRIKLHIRASRKLHLVSAVCWSVGVSKDHVVRSTPEKLHSEKLQLSKFTVPLAPRKLVRTKLHRVKRT